MDTDTTVSESPKQTRWRPEADRSARCGCVCGQEAGGMQGSELPGVQPDAPQQEPHGPPDHAVPNDFE
eukprot:3594324-Rhodomonas_salina.1